MKIILKNSKRVKSENGYILDDDVKIISLNKNFKNKNRKVYLGKIDLSNKDCIKHE